MAFQDVMQNLQLVDIFYPPGSYYETSDPDFDPNVRWGGIWELESEGLVHIGAGENYLIGDTGGEETHTLTVDEMPNHTHGIRLEYGAQASPSYPPGGSYAQVTSNTSYGYYNNNIMIQPIGGSQPHNNMQPYKVVNRWHRLENITRLNLASHGSWVDSGTEVDGHKVYKSESSYHVQNAWDTAKIIFKGFRKFQIAIRSYAESSCDYVLVSTLNNDYLVTQANTAAMRNAYNNAEYTKAYTRSKQSATDYEIVTFDNLNKNQEYYFYVIYQKDSSQDSNDDRGYFYIITE